MKKYLLIVLGLVGMAANSQNSYIIKKDGTKIIVDDNLVHIIEIDSRVSYRLPGKEWEKYVKFEDLDYLVQGGTLFKSFNLDGAKKSSPYFVLAQTPEKFLLSKVITVTTQNGSMVHTSEYYYYRIIDKNSKTLDYGQFKGSKLDRNTEAKAIAVGQIKSNFSDCPALLERLATFNTGDEDMMNLLGFFYNPIYVTCN